MSLLAPLTTYDFDEPDSVREAERKIAILSEKISEIADELDDKSRRPNPEFAALMMEYMGWRERAKSALRLKRAHKNFLRGWIREYREDEKEKIQTLQEAVDEAMPFIMKSYPVCKEDAIISLAKIAGWKMEGFEK